MTLQHGNYVVPGANGQRLRFSGTLLASSSSRRPNSHRWVEFNLYLSDGGSFVLGRVGHSTLYHRVDCEVVQRNRLEVDAVPQGGFPCELCEPDFEGSPVCPERPRYWAAVFTDPQALVAALQRDNGQTKYVTNVAARLVEQAAVHNRGLAEIWMTLLVD
jgi:hypothetical protein